MSIFTGTEWSEIACDLLELRLLPSRSEHSTINNNRCFSLSTISVILTLQNTIVRV